mgnify:CR=1 FL=1
MNPLLQVKLRFSHERNNRRPGPRNLKANAETTTEMIESLCEELKSVLRYYRNSPRILQGFLVDVHYNDIIAKTNRIRELLKPSGKTTNDVVVGARFSEAPEGEENHIITYYVDGTTIERTINDLQIIKRFLSVRLGGKATPSNFNEPDSHINYDGFDLSPTKIRNLIVDCSVVESISVPQITSIPEQDTFIVTFFKTELALSTLLEKLGIDDTNYRYSFYGNDTLSISKDLLDILVDRVPYLISMVSSDLSKVTLNEIQGMPQEERIQIPAPNNEPIIGVIDTLFDENVYFSNWVDNTDYLDEIEKLLSQGDKRQHGTEVSSIIVDGPRLNPWLDDGCGRFRVRHFGVCTTRINTPRLIRKIREIVDKNPDIHVWNISLGTEEEVSRNFISYDAAALDEIQAKKNVIFVISGTNDNRDEKTGTLKVGSPADSLCSVVVNSVRRDGRPTSYSRKGNILSFFNKPDVSYYGGDFDDRIIAYAPWGENDVWGTSFAAPWISRKLCYLIDVMGLPREVAKALIIDSAASWDFKRSTFKNKDLMGYGIVPINISNILGTDSDEIRFVLYDTAESYRTTNYGIPVPRDSDGKYPFVARATLCYFPECTRSQGVDYTDRELSLQFGRINSKGNIDDINENVQDDAGAHVNERQSRRDFRKWENTKFISKILKNNRPLKSYEDRQWGIAITSKERLTNRTVAGLKFGAVITLKEINGVNRIQDFIRACTLRGWIVNELNIENQLEVYNTSQEEIVLE